MNKNINLYSILFIIILIVTAACGDSRAASDYKSHLDKVLLILKENKDNVSEAGSVVLNYIKSNEAKIKKLLEQMREYSAYKTEKVYKPVMEAVKKLFEYINTNTTEKYPLGNNEELIKALKILNII